MCVPFLSWNFAHGNRSNQTHGLPVVLLITYSKAQIQNQTLRSSLVVTIFKIPSSSIKIKSPIFFHLFTQQKKSGFLRFSAGRASNNRFDLRVGMEKQHAKTMREREHLARDASLHVVVARARPQGYIEGGCSVSSCISSFPTAVSRYTHKPPTMRCSHSHAQRSLIVVERITAPSSTHGKQSPSVSRTTACKPLQSE